jgi:hypothetical protein
LQPGDAVVSRGNFLLDSQFQISGKSSLLYPEGMAGGGHTGHDHATQSNAQPKMISPEKQALIAKNLGMLTAADRQLAIDQANCPVTGDPLGVMGVPVKLNVDGRSMFICCAACESMVRKDPQGILEKLKPRPRKLPANQ